LGVFARVASSATFPRFPFLFLSFIFVDGAFSRAAFSVVSSTAVAAGGGVLSTRPRFNARPVSPFPLLVDRRYELRFRK